MTRLADGISGMATAMILRDEDVLGLALLDVAAEALDRARELSRAG